MCLLNTCKGIEIWEIRDGEKVVLHRGETGLPVLVQYWNYNNGLDGEYLPGSLRNRRVSRTLKRRRADLGKIKS